MELEINGVPESLEFKRRPDLITFSTQKDSSIKEFKFRITSDRTKPMYQLDSGDFISVVQDGDLITGSGKISGIRDLTYDRTDDGYFELNLDAEEPFHVVLINNSERPTKAKLIIEPLPKKFKLELPGIVKQTSIEFPDITNLTKIIDYSQIVFTLGKLGNDLINLLGNMTESLIDSIGNIGYNFSISYELEGSGT